MNYLKSISAVAATVLSAIVAALTDGNMEATEWINVAVLAVGAAGVFAAPNVPGARYTKSVLAALAAVLTLAITLISGGITPAEWLQLAVTGLGALGVYAAPYTPSGPLAGGGGAHAAT